MSIAITDKAPDFTLTDQSGRSVRLSQFKGRWVLLYFYPKDDTPGCTKEACALTENLPSFEALDAVVLGVSADSVESHKKFAEKYQLSFQLLSDTQKQVIKAYGVWGEKSMYGKTYEGIHRMSFLIDPRGFIARIYPTVKPTLHAQEVIDDLKKLKEEGR